VTVFFATGHSKVLSGMEPTPESNACGARQSSAEAESN
jgi:hypothetical protein